jgi:hypothetical protein
MPRLALPRRLFVTALAVLLAGAAPSAQDARRADAPRPLTITAADYARAERFLAAGVNPLVIGGQVNANWLGGDRFWYRCQVAGGYEFILVDPAARTRQPAFNHAAVAKALSVAAKSNYSAHTLPFQSIQLSDDARSVSFDAAGPPLDVRCGGREVR